MDFSRFNFQLKVSNIFNFDQVSPPCSLCGFLGYTGGELRFTPLRLSANLSTAFSRTKMAPCNAKTGGIQTKLRFFPSKPILSLSGQSTSRWPAEQRDSHFGKSPILPIQHQSVHPSFKQPHGALRIEFAGGGVNLGCGLWGRKRREMLAGEILEEFGIQKQYRRHDAIPVCPRENGILWGFSDQGGLRSRVGRAAPSPVIFSFLMEAGIGKEALLRIFD